MKISSVMLAIIPLVACNQTLVIAIGLRNQDQEPLMPFALQMLTAFKDISGSGLALSTEVTLSEKSKL